MPIRSVDAASDVNGVLREVTRPLREADVPYMLVGALAVFVHGAPRTTNDLDLVVDTRAVAVERLRALLETLGHPVEGPDETEFGRRLRVWHPSFPVEIFLAGSHPYHAEEFARARSHMFGRVAHGVISAEDLVVRKLRNLWIRRSQTDVADLVSILVAQRGNLDIDDLRRRARFFRVLEPFEEILRNLPEPDGDTP